MELESLFSLTWIRTFSDDSDSGLDRSDSAVWLGSNFAALISCQPNCLSISIVTTKYRLSVNTEAFSFLMELLTFDNIVPLLTFYCDVNLLFLTACSDCKHRILRICRTTHGPVLGLKKTRLHSLPYNRDPWLGAGSVVNWIYPNLWIGLV